jgi:LysM repeat protein
MISPNLSEIGAGVAITNGRVYFVIDCALPTTDVLPQGATSVPGSASSVLTPNAPISVTTLSTPNSDGDVIHEVQPGQSLWQLAIAYEVKIDDIKRLNNLFDDNIYPGNKLLIKQDLVQLTASPTAATTAEPNLTPTNVTVFSTATFLSTTIIPVSTEMASSASASLDNNSIRVIAMSIIALALLGGGVFTWLGSRRKADH